MTLLCAAAQVACLDCLVYLMQVKSPVAKKQGSSRSRRARHLPQAGQQSELFQEARARAVAHSLSQSHRYLLIISRGAIVLQARAFSFQQLAPLLEPSSIWYGVYKSSLSAVNCYELLVDTAMMVMQLSAATLEQ